MFQSCLFAHHQKISHPSSRLYSGHFVRFFKWAFENQATMSWNCKYWILSLWKTL